MSVVGDFVNLPFDDSGNLPPDDWLDVEITQERLLLYNERFIADIEAIRQKYDITVGSQGDYSESAYMDYMSNPPSITTDSDFIKDVKQIVKHIQLPGDWEKTIIDYVFGIDNVGLGTFEYEKAVRGRIVDNDNQKYVEIRLYGDVTIPDIRKSAKSIRELIVQSKPTKKPYDTDIGVGATIDDLRQQGLTYEQIWEKLSDSGKKYEDYHHTHKVHTRFKKRVDEVYAQNLPKD